MEVVLSDGSYWHADDLDTTAAAVDNIWRRESMVNKLISTVYSGPTISDIESALSFTSCAGDARSYISTPPLAFSAAEKVENKYTMKIKQSGSQQQLADDGYKWRKYGQKSIKNSPNPRSYYRCTNPRCNAKKQVERAADEPDTLLVTYEGLHLHYTYSHFLHHQTSSSPKKPKLTPQPAAADYQIPTTSSLPSSSMLQPDPSPLDAPAHHCNVHVDGFLLMTPPNCSSSFLFDPHEETTAAADGLLEDMVPLLVRQPSSTTSIDSTSTVGSPPAPVSSPSWSTPYIDMAIFSNIF